MAVPSRIQVSDIDGIMVVRFTDHQLFDERPVREIAEQIAINLPSDGTPIRLILDFSDVGLLSSIALGKFILIQRRVDATRGSLRLCELSSVLQQVFRTANLDRLFTIDRDLRTSLEALRGAGKPSVKPEP
jgi:anti-sigma B factor antagonist